MRSTRRFAAAISPLAVFFTAGCGHLAPAEPRVAAADAKVQPAPAAGVKVSDSAPERRVGDFFVHRFSGSFASEPLTLTEEVVAAEDQAWVVDFALSQNEQLERLRVRFDRASGKLLSVSRFNGKAETPATVADYEGLVARTVYAADLNDGLVSESKQTCLVGSDELDCETKTYKVWIGESAATLAVVHSSTYADRDVSGEITSADGKLLYRAELVEAKLGKPSSGFASR